MKNEIEKIIEIYNDKVKKIKKLDTEEPMDCGLLEISVTCIVKQIDKLFNTKPFTKLDISISETCKVSNLDGTVYLGSNSYGLSVHDITLISDSYLKIGAALQELHAQLKAIDLENV